jgi:hypothetical protein
MYFYKKKKVLENMTILKHYEKLKKIGNLLKIIPIIVNSNISIQ